MSNILNSYCFIVCYFRRNCHQQMTPILPSLWWISWTPWWMNSMKRAPLAKWKTERSFHGLRYVIVKINSMFVKYFGTLISLSLKLYRIVFLEISNQENCLIYFTCSSTKTYIDWNIQSLVIRNWWLEWEVVSGYLAPSMLILHWYQRSCI